MVPPPKSEWAFESAPAPYILRAAEKDDAYMRQVTDDVEDMLTRVLGTRWVNAYEKELKFASCGFYYLLTTTGGRQTLGEEYCDLMQIHATSLLPQTTPSRAMQILLYCGVPYVVEKWVPRGLTHLRDNSHAVSVPWRGFVSNVHQRQIQLKAAIREVMRFHLALFFLFGEYYHLSYRAAKTKMLLMSRPMPGMTSYSVLGWLIVIQQFCEAFALIRSLLKKRTAPTSTPGTTPTSPEHQEEEDEEDDGDGLDGRCSLCLGMRDRANGPTTATICGHLFCWDCVTGLCRSTPSPLCPLCRERITLQTLAPVYRYKSH